MAPALADVLVNAAAEIDDLSTRPTPGGFEFVVGGRVIAAVEGAVAEFRLDPAVAGAALRTPDTKASPTSSERIAFAPVTVDRYALDRAVAWLASAARLASKRLN
jgi:hypothetical protein